MVGYVIGAILTMISAILFQLFGISLCKNQKSYSYSFVMGYLCYSFLVAVGGIPIQLLNLPWMTFFWYMIFILVAIVSYIIFSFYTKKVILKKQDFVLYIKDQWFLYIGAIVLVAFALTHISIIWLNNMSDDAYYLTKMATLPYLDNPFRTDYSTGFVHSKIDSYAFNTFELEASFYIFLTKMDPSLYARGFLSLLNYFVLLNTIKCFFELVLNKMKINFEISKLQYYVMTIFVVFVLSATVFIITDAQWTILSAAYYGSALERIGCIFFILIPLMDFNGLNLKKVLITFATCVVMISKSTVAIPLLYMLAVGYCILELFRNKTTKKYAIILIILIFLIGLIIPGNAAVESAIIENISVNFKGFFIVVSMVLFGVFSFKYPVMRRLLFIIISSFMLMLIPVVNHLTEFSMNYEFVAVRTIYSILVFTLICSYGLAIIYFGNFLLKKHFYLLSNVILVICIFVFSAKYTYEWTYPLKAFHVLKTNINLIPDSTILLGNKLEEYYQGTGRVLNMVMTPGVFPNGLGHFSSQIVRAYCPHTISVTAGLRTKEKIEYNSSFDGFSVNDIECFNQFFVNPNQDTLLAVENLCNQYPIDCIVANDINEINVQLLRNIGFIEYDSVTDPQASPAITYTIFVKS